MAVGARQKRWIFLGAGALFLVAMALWVFRASQKEQAKKRASFGADNFQYSIMNGGVVQQQAVDPKSPANNPAKDPNVQETLKVINEINRVNQMNAELRKNAPPTTPPPPKKDR